MFQENTSLISSKKISVVFHGLRCTAYLKHRLTFRTRESQAFALALQNSKLAKGTYFFWKISACTSIKFCLSAHHHWPWENVFYIARPIRMLLLNDSIAKNNISGFSFWKLICGLTVIFSSMLSLLRRERAAFHTSRCLLYSFLSTLSSVLINYL